MSFKPESVSLPVLYLNYHQLSKQTLTMSFPFFYLKYHHYLGKEKRTMDSWGVVLQSNWL